MNKFIVWYENEKLNTIFSREFTLDDLIDQDHLDEICDSPLLKDYKVKEINRCVGKTDINNKKIYADCSIFEFAHRYVKDGYWHDCILRGLFTYSEDKLCYVIELLPNNIYKVNFLSFNENSGLFQIIDTIQENKLGLISKKQA